MSRRKLKTLLIGSAGYSCSNESHQLNCCAWSALAVAPNPRDFDIIVINLLELTPDCCDWDAFHKVFHSKVVRDVLFNGGAIIVVGDPRFDMPFTSPQGISGMVPFLTWSGISFEWDNQPGDTIVLSQDRRHDRYREYLSRLKSWGYSLVECKLSAARTKDRTYETVTTIGLATNRYRHHMAFEVVLAKGQDETAGGYGGSRFVARASGTIVFLPPISATPEDTLKLALRDVCGLNICSDEPKWIQLLSAPRQAEVDKRIQEVSEEIELLQKRLADYRSELVECRQPIKLLYEREFVLEPLVLEMLQRLGAVVEKPVESNKEDGWITVRVGGLLFEGVLEIKSTKKDHFTEDGRKQLIDWVQRGIAQRQKKFKGIFIGNSAVDRPSEQRSNPFPDTWAKAAQLSEICAFTTTQLYQAYQKDCLGQLDRDHFWRSIFECDGVCKFDGLI